MTDPQALLEAHVAFELARWSGDRLEVTVQEHAGAVREWLEETLVSEVAPAGPMATAARRLAADLVLTDEMIAVVAEIAATGHATLLAQDRPLGDLVAEEEYVALVGLVATQEAARREVIDAITASKAYSRLVSHVLYQGLKGYLLTENVLARKVPGASSLVRLGQRGLNSAAPKLEAGVDRRLTAFVETNLSETLKESRRYLAATLDQEVLSEMAEEAWTAVTGRSLGSLLELVDPVDTAALVSAFGPVLRRWRDGGLLGEVAEAVVLEELTRRADQTVGEVLVECGIATEPLVDDVLALLRPTLEHARATGFLERRVRAELEPFYAALPHLLEEPHPGTAPPKAPGPAKKAPVKKTAAKKTAVKKPAARSPRSRSPR